MVNNDGCSDTTKKIREICWKIMRIKRQFPQTAPLLIKNVWDIEDDHRWNTCITLVKIFGDQTWGGGTCIINTLT